ncbi:hypothetical protein AB0903_33655 [Streptomyces sp. NPDC048389]|uniref:hypothetical protein n=1 Tax=Streptomyces sp. NPDC048389 TaxID=3154622 RepID=UPI0034513319
MILRILPGAALAAMALGRPGYFDDMPAIPTAHGLTSGAASAVLAVALTGAEAVTAGWFLTPPRSRAATPVRPHTGVAVVWPALAAQEFARGLVLDNCGCFDTSLVRPLRWYVLVTDAPMPAVRLAAVAGAAAGPARLVARHGSDSPDPAGEPLMRIIAALRALEHATRPYDREFAEAMERRWAELPDSARTPGQILGRHGVGCEGTHGVFPKCNLKCTPCYHSRDANQVRVEVPPLIGRC